MAQVAATAYHIHIVGKKLARTSFGNLAKFVNKVDISYLKTSRLLHKFYS